MKRVLSQKTVRGYSIKESGFGYIVNLNSDSRDVNDVTVVCFPSYFAHFNYSPASCSLTAAVVAIDVFPKSFRIVSTRRRRHAASETGFVQDLANDSTTGSLVGIHVSFLLLLLLLLFDTFAPPPCRGAKYCEQRVRL